MQLSGYKPGFQAERTKACLANTFMHTLSCISDYSFALDVAKRQNYRKFTKYSILYFHLDNEQKVFGGVHRSCFCCGYVNKDTPNAIQPDTRNSMYGRATYCT